MNNIEKSTFEYPAARSEPAQATNEHALCRDRAIFGRGAALITQKIDVQFPGRTLVTNEDAFRRDPAIKCLASPARRSARMRPPVITGPEP